MSPTDETQRKDALSRPWGSSHINDLNEETRPDWRRSSRGAEAPEPDPLLPTFSGVQSSQTPAEEDPGDVDDILFWLLRNRR